MQVTERFLKYVSFDTTSSETSDAVPTTAHQKELGRYLADELARRGHPVRRVEDYTDTMGHAGAIRIDPQTGVLQGGTDPRGDGLACGY